VNSPASCFARTFPAYGQCRCFRQREQAAEIPNLNAGGKRSEPVERQARQGPALASAAKANNREAAIGVCHDDSGGFDALRRKKVDADRIPGRESSTDQHDDRGFALAEEVVAKRQHALASGTPEAVMIRNDFAHRTFFSNTPAVPLPRLAVAAIAFPTKLPPHWTPRAPPKRTADNDW
jgi:hypothetical protein